MTGRRWRDWVDTDGVEVTGFDRARRWFRAAWPFVGPLAAVAVIVQATIISVGAIRDRDRLAVVATNAAAAARDAKSAADAAFARAEEAAPCNPGDPAEKPGCVRDEAMAEQVRTVVRHINEALAKGLAAHDLNSHEDHEDLRRLLARRSAPLPTRPPITAAAQAPTAAAPPPPAPAPPTSPPPGATTSAPVPDATTTTCPRLPNGKCRP